MKRILCFLPVFTLLAVLAACSSVSGGQTAQTASKAAKPAGPASDPAPTGDTKAPAAPDAEIAKDSQITIQITAGGRTFPAKLYDNLTTRAFLKKLPMTVTMEELNGNEKYYYLPEPLPTDSYRPAQIKAGELMLFGSDCLVLFYDGFSTSYRYTRLGYVEDAAGLSDALGRQGAEVTFGTE